MGRRHREGRHRTTVNRRRRIFTCDRPRHDPSFSLPSSGREGWGSASTNSECRVPPPRPSPKTREREREEKSEESLMPDDGVKLDIAIATYGHPTAVKDHRAPINGVTPNFIEVVPIIGAFRRMVRDAEFDVCEMAPTTYLIARARGAPYIALPIFMMRRFHHGGFVVRPDSGIKVPKDLEGRRVGVRAYSVTTGVWTRGIFI